MMLGRFRITAFPASEVKNMKVNTKSNELAKAACILRETLRCLSWQSGRHCLSQFYQNVPDWYLGIELKTSNTANGRMLKRMLRPPKSYVAFFGYQSLDEGPTELSVWFYCGSNKRRQQIARLLRKKFKKFQGYRVIEDQNEGRWYYLIVSTKRHGFRNDREWFCHIFQALGVEIRS